MDTQRIRVLTYLPKVKLMSRQGYTKDLCSHLFTKGKIGVKAGINKGSVFSPTYQR